MQLAQLLYLYLGESIMAATNVLLRDESLLMSPSPLDPRRGSFESQIFYLFPLFVCVIPLITVLWDSQGFSDFENCVFLFVVEMDLIRVSHLQEMLLLLVASRLRRKLKPLRASRDK